MESPVEHSIGVQISVYGYHLENIPDASSLQISGLIQISRTAVSEGTASSTETVVCCWWAFCNRQDTTFLCFYVIEFNQSHIGDVWVFSFFSLISFRRFAWRPLLRRCEANEQQDHVGEYRTRREGIAPGRIIGHSRNRQRKYCSWTFRLTDLH